MKKIDSNYINNNKVQNQQQPSQKRKIEHTQEGAIRLIEPQKNNQEGIKDIFLRTVERENKLIYYKVERHYNGLELMEEINTKQFLELFIFLLIREIRLHNKIDKLFNFFDTILPQLHHLLDNIDNRLSVNINKLAFIHHNFNDYSIPSQRTSFLACLYYLFPKYIQEETLNLFLKEYLHKELNQYQHLFVYLDKDNKVNDIGTTYKFTPLLEIAIKLSSCKTLLLKELSQVFYEFLELLYNQKVPEDKEEYDQLLKLHPSPFKDCLPSAIDVIHEENSPEISIEFNDWIDF